MPAAYLVGRKHGDDRSSSPGPATDLQWDRRLSCAVACSVAGSVRRVVEDRFRLFTQRKFRDLRTVKRRQLQPHTTQKTASSRATCCSCTSCPPRNCLRAVSAPTQARR